MTAASWPPAKDKIALAVVAVDEHAHGLERDVEGHDLRLPVGAKGQRQTAGHPGECCSNA